MSAEFPAAYTDLRQRLRAEPRTWLVTGAAGFIGSNLLQELLELGQNVVGLDNFSTGHRANIDAALDVVADGHDRLRFFEGDIRDLDACRTACNGVDFVLHQAALGSVPRSISDPVTSSHVNVDGFLNILVAAKDSGVQRIVYASSSSVYGDCTELPQRENRTGRPLSPYAATKVANEMYAEVFQRTYELKTIGLRYFNVFGARQDPKGAYAAVIPRWISAILDGTECKIFGDGETSRDFCYIANVVQANLLAAASAPVTATGRAYNIACGDSTSLTTLFYAIRDGLAEFRPDVAAATPVYADFRPGDIARSFANIDDATAQLGYAPTHRLREGLAQTLAWYVDTRASNAPHTRPQLVRPSL